jgi:glucokinase
MKEVAIGIDIGGTNSEFGFVNHEGDVIAHGKINTIGYPDAKDFVSALCTKIEEVRKTIKEEIILKGIGIGAPNGNYYTGTIEHAPNLEWKGIVHLAEMFRKHYPGALVSLTNDANAAAIGEMIYGGAKNMKEFIVITLGTGLGSGIVINGELVYGHTGFAGELGHTIVITDGRICGCGRQGCLENYASATGIKRTVFELLAKFRDDSPLRAITYNDLTAKMVTEAAEKGDKIALEAFDYTAKMLALGIVNSVAFSSPEAIFLFGGLAQAGDFIFKPTQKYVDQNMLFVFKDSIKILPSQIKESNAAVLGASALVWKELAKA